MLAGKAETSVDDESSSAKKTALSRGLEPSVALDSPGIESLQTLVIRKQVACKASTLAYENMYTYIYIIYIYMHTYIYSTCICITLVITDKCQRI